MVSTGFNYFGSQRTVTDENKWDFRIDYNISSKDKVFGRLTRDVTDETVAIPQPGADRIYPLHSWLAVLSWSRGFPAWLTRRESVWTGRFCRQADRSRVETATGRHFSACKTSA